MNIDTFLDEQSGSGDEDGDIIDINTDSVVKKSDNVSVPIIKRESVSSDSISADNSKNQSSINEKSSFKDKLQYLVKLVQANISKGDLSKALDYYSQIVLLSKEIPVDKVDAKNTINYLIQDYHSKIIGKIKDVKLDFDAHSEIISKMLGKVKEEINARNLYKAASSMKQIKIVYASLSDDFSEKKILIYGNILKADLAIDILRKEFFENLFVAEKQKILSLIKQFDSFLSRNDFLNAFDICVQMESAYWNMPKGYLEERLTLYGEILKKKNAVELAFQISSLQNELVKKGVKVNTFDASKTNFDSTTNFNSTIASTNSVKNVNMVPGMSSEIISELGVVGSTPSLSTKMNDVSNTKSNAQPSPNSKINSNTDVDSNIDKLRADFASGKLSDSLLLNANQKREIISVSDEKLSQNSVKDALLKLNVAKVKIEVLEGNYDSALKMVNGLISSNSSDEKVLGQLNNLKNNILTKQRSAVAPSNDINKFTLESRENEVEEEIFEKKIEDVSAEVSSGNLDLALQDIKTAEGNPSFKSFEPQIENSVRDASRSIADAIVERKLALARKQIEAEDYDGAKANVARALALDPTNNRALIINRMLAGK